MKHIWQNKIDKKQYNINNLKFKAMKFSKSLFLAFAGLGLFACSNEDVVDGGNVINGPADVAVKINLPGMTGISRAVEDFTSNENVTVNYIEVALAAEKGGTTKTFKGEDVNSIMDGTKATVEFVGVESPKNITVKINTKKGASYTEDVKYETLSDLQKITVAGTRMTGSTATFTASGSNSYIATVDMDHTMARLEFGGIKHVDDGDECILTSGDLSGVFLTNVKLKSSDADNKVWGEGEITDLKFFDSTCPVSDKVTGTGFFESTTTYPGENQAYAYNIYPATGEDKLPQLSLYFTNVERKDAWSSDNAYAIVSAYKLGGNADSEVVKALCGDNASVGEDGKYKVKNFPAGYVYKVKSLEIPDNAIHTDPQGEGVKLVATINVTPWEIVEGSVDWKK